MVSVAVGEGWKRAVAATRRCTAILYEMPLGSWHATWIGVRFRCLLTKGHLEIHHWWSDDALLHMGWVGKGPKRPQKEESGG